MSQARITSFFAKEGAAIAPRLPGQIRVGRREFPDGSGRALPDPSWPGFTPIVVMTPRSAYGPLSPYAMRDREGRIIENVYQSYKAYATVPAINESLGKWSRLRWTHPHETHIDPVTGCLTQAYVDWRAKLAVFPEAVRYPVGRAHRHACLGAIVEDPPRAGHVPDLLGYIASRKELYARLYEDGLDRDASGLAQQLRARHLAGENLLIIEVDVAPQRSLAHYIDTYGVDATFIERHTQLITPRVLQIMINDPLEQCGHGYFLAKWLLGLSMDEIDRANRPPVEADEA
jgi:hypothetical protein